MLETCYALAGQGFCDAVAGALVVVLIVLLLIVAGAIGLLVIAARQMREIDIPPDADFFETLRLIPITIPLALDMLDLVLDVFAAPLSWAILELLGLKALRFVTVTEGLIPGTQAIPTLTLAWVIARLTGPSEPSEIEVRIRERPFAARRQTVRRRGLEDDEAAGNQDAAR